MSGRVGSITTEIITDGLVFNMDAANRACYPRTGTTWFDTIGTNNATFVNGPTFVSEDAGGIDFDGVNDRATFDTPTAITDSLPLTVDIWFNGIPGASAAGGYSYILHNNSADTTVGNSFLTVGVSGAGGSVNDEYYAALNGNHINMSSDIAQSTSTVTNLILTWDLSTQKLYGNGILKASEALSGTVQNRSSITSLGSYRTSTYRVHNGTIFSLKFYNRALSATEVLHNYNALKGRFGL